VAGERPTTRCRSLRGLHSSNEALPSAQSAGTFLFRQTPHCDLNDRLAVFEPSFDRPFLVSPLDPQVVTRFWF